MRKATVVILLLLPIFFSSFPAKGENYDFYLFYSVTCSSCASARRYLSELRTVYPQVTFHELEIVKNRKNQDFFTELNRELKISTPGVPILIFGDDYLVGFRDSETYKRKVEGMIARQLRLQTSLSDGRIRERPLFTRLITKRASRNTGYENGEMILPFVGRVDPGTLSLPAFTLFLGLIDGINPCALWVLMFLLTLLATTRNSRKLIIVGTVFVLVSALVYFLFMLAWLNIFIVLGFQAWITLAFAVVVIIIGLINVKEFFWFRKGFSLMIPERAKPALLRRMRIIMENPRLSLSIAGTVSLAFLVNLIEFGCTIGLPAVYTKVLSHQHTAMAAKYLYTVLYCGAYVVPLLALVLLFFITLGRYHIQEKHGRILKLSSGLLMLVMGILLAFAPELLMFR